MKLSDVRGERVFDVIADIIDPIANIAGDEVAAELFKRKRVPKGTSVRQFMMQRVKESVPTLLREHKRDVLTVLAAINGTSVEEYSEGLTLVSLLKDCTELLTDDVFTTLFISAETGKPSGSATVNTGERGE